ncbi:hypothetical protein JHK87_013356 [Glycine soja]|nr:hypothetical protein JHK87_013356 [Glycine soja]
MTMSGPEEHGSMSLMGSLRVIELQLVAFALVFSASGLVPLLDLAYSALISIYLMLLGRFAFPSHGCAPGPMFHESGLFQVYVVVGTTVGLFLPLAYVLGGFGRGDKQADKAWFWFGRVLAVANLVYFSINLFGFLIPRFLPRAFMRYFQERGEIYAKLVEEKRYVNVVNNKSHPPDKK